MTKTNLPKLAGVKYVVRTVKGRTYAYAYHRGTGDRIKPAAGGTIGDVDFLLEVKRLDGVAAAAAEADPAPGSLGELITAYRGSPEFAILKPRTRADYQDVFDYLNRIDDMDARLIDAPFVIGLRDKAFKKHKRRFANYVVQVLRLLYTWALPRRRGLAANPAMSVPLIRRPKGARVVNRAWKDWEKPVVMAALPMQLKWPIALAMYAGLREGDLCNAKREVWTGIAVDLEAQGKTDNPHWVPAQAELRRIHGQYKKWLEKRKLVPLYLCVNSRGRKWTESGMRASFFKIIRELVAGGKVGTGLTIHGLRHTMGRDIVDAGGDSRDVAAAIGDTTSAMGDHYSREADRRARAKKNVTRLDQARRRSKEAR